MLSKPTKTAEKRVPATGLTPQALSEADPRITLAEARKIVASVHRDEPLGAPVKEVRRLAVSAAHESFFVPSLTLKARKASSLDPFVKYLFATPDEQLLETVRIPLEKTGRFSACVSSQIGCALACDFCATGRLGLTRNLETWEIVEQVRIVRRELSVGQRIHGEVFQGMGEPLANLDRVLEAIAVMTEPSALAIDARNITVCTSGLPTGILRLAEEAPKVRLGLSISSALTETRRRLMPIDKAHPLENVIDAVVIHAKRTGMSPMWAVTLLAGVNDTPDHARAFARLALDFTQRSGVRPRISVIPYNAMGEGVDDPYRRTSEDAENLFRDTLREAGVFTHKRYSGGGDVDAACGQLAGRV